MIAAVVLQYIISCTKQESNTIIVFNLADLYDAPYPNNNNICTKYSGK